ncbi:NADPH-dependent FMN reductase [Shouchella sp. JSM 1781072]|uniref:NADPH-dependent FMN reductase n=1 Tax=Bacillaceae TaxID=186817 RepID=UPI000C069765|nr:MULTISPECIES: NADPH-dependent FMN reductase [Bacillaceae]UTR05827.1 NAD(P)H-dependent oxidoreductase [Alkalihalobacillus sp. LMS6]
MKLLAISGTITGSKTLAMIKKTVERIQAEHPEVEAEILNLKDYQLDFCDGRDPSTYEGDTKDVIQRICSADFFLIGTPIFQGSMTGALKNLFDLAPVSAFRYKVMGFIATAGTYQHYLVIENQLKPIAGYFRAFTAPSYIYANSEHFDEMNQVIDPDVLKRIERLAEELVFMQSTIGENRQSSLLQA